MSQARKPYKICILNSNYPPSRGGIATFSGKLAEYLANSARVRRVTVVAFNNPRPRQEQSGKLEIFAYPKTSLLAMASKIFRQILKHRDSDVFHATTIFPVGAFVWLFAGFFLRKKVFITVHGTDVLTREGSAKTRWVKRKIMSAATKVLANSLSTAELAAKANGVALKKFEVIYPGVDQKVFVSRPENVRAKYHLSNKDFVVLSVCRLVRRKGVDDIIAAIAKIPQADVKLLIVGAGEEEGRLRDQVSQLGLTERVKFTGRVSDEEVVNCYASADLFVAASKFLLEAGDIEGLGISLLEAQYFGLPVIGTLSGGIPEAVKPNETGFLVGEGDCGAIAEKIMELKNNPALRRRMGENARKFVRQNFSWEGSARKHLEIYSHG